MKANSMYNIKIDYIKKTKRIEQLQENYLKYKGGFNIMKQKKWFLLVALVALVVLVAPRPTFASEENVRAFMQSVNDQLLASGENFQLSMIESHSSAKSGSKPIASRKNIRARTALP